MDVHTGTDMHPHTDITLHMRRQMKNPMELKGRGKTFTGNLCESPFYMFLETEIQEPVLHH